jgi:pterin-4a-carbinolamine dehydratase
MTAVAIIAEKSDHHQIGKNVYNKVTIDLTLMMLMESQGFQLAKGIDQIVKNYANL